jgi:glycosyltransferase involved in cell wall biosynthesis
LSRTAIIVSPYFPPSTVAGVHRARHLAKHLPTAGWAPVVVAVDEAYHEERLDPGLAALVPPSVEVVKVPALSARLCRPFGLGEISVRAWRPLRQAVLHLIERRRVGAVLITGSPYYPMLMASAIRQRFGVPVVLDFQDPWVSRWGATLPRCSKGGVTHQLAEWLEPKAVRAADFITSVSETQNEEMAARYPWLDHSRMTAIPIGGDPADYEALRGGNAVGDPHGLFRPGAITLSYVGTFMPRTEPLMKVFLQAFARVRARHPEVMTSVRLLFVGTSNQPNDTTGFRVRPLAEAHGLADIVDEVPQRVPYLEAIGVMARSDGIMLIGSDEAHYTASKIYPGLMAGRPFISLFHRMSSAHAILSAAGGGVTFAFGSESELSSLRDGVADGILTLVRDGRRLGRPNRDAYAPYEASAIAAKFAEIFDRLSSQRSKSAQCAW